MKSLRGQSGFTLIELLATIAIIVCLAGLLQPALATAHRKAQCAACASNLRQLGVAVLQYSADNEQKLPIIEPWPSQPVYGSGSGAQSIVSALGQYGITQQVLKCPIDLVGPNYAAKEGSSYQWFPGASNTNLLNVSPVGSLMLFFDYSNIHNQLSNVLFADGHVAGAVAN